MNKNDTGRLGELAAARYLRKAGCEILSANYRTRFGEIDLIASDGRFLIFAEVKTRRENSLFLPREAVDQKKQEKIIAAAKLYLSVNQTKLQPRFDVIEVVTAAGGEFQVLSIHQIENAFTL
ncbi:MAG TPA: YraN family protein [Clostridia bacterium]|nr:YraN family protein [Clostridia bacterium]